MSPPVKNATTQDPTNPSAPEESPEIKAARERYREAGYARNRAELIYKQAVESKDAEAVKQAKADVEQAQGEVNKCQEELMKLLGLSWKPNAQAKTPKKKTEEPAKVAKGGVFDSFIVRERFEKIQKGEYFYKKVHIIELKNENILELKKFLEKIEKSPNKSQIFRYISPPRGEMMIRHPYFKAIQKEITKS